MRFFAAWPLLALTASLALAEDQKKTITLTPALGAEFGKIIEIEGRIVDDTDTRMRAHLGKKLIDASKVDGVALKKPVVIELEVCGFAKMELPGRGAQVKLRGYESGGFVGIPQEAFKDIPSVATTNHFFESNFQVTKRLDTAPVKQAAK